MNFQETEEQRLLADSVQRLLDRQYDFETRRSIVSSAEGYSEEVWRALASIGLMAVPFAQADGGFEGGAIDLFGPMAALGAALVVEPVSAALAPAGRLIATLAPAKQRGDLIGGVVEGARRLAFAHFETAFFPRLDRLATVAEPDGPGWRLSGEKRVVVHAPMANTLVVTARVISRTGSADSPGVFVVDSRAAGVEQREFRTIDGFRASDISFRHVALAEDARLGGGTDPREAVDEAIDFATALSCAEAVGVIDFANRTTLEYLKTRKQFGVAIGSFQALQHRIVEMTIQAAQARSIALLACSKVDAAARGEATAGERMRAVSAARILVGAACRNIGQEAIQLHGAMGMMDEMKISHAFRRLTMLGQQFGDADAHLERFAATDAMP